ncbi:tRNA-dihydrouridine(20) synthase [NAD(P)+]-like isoform X2 [Sitodiplosis mosellana]|uniref:tRNA-dihydrouridine(20) synthase [NAD(P)+]-like isoform X2 n=1 Tax=Sitodiplosis mosellana TaxID=263140 RepID=UPI002443D1E0|nr:tRNA-dihydrouridine(20) synthase [NAD(P)+]-like isoform X2 [Sitodiplosis mosellana]
MNYCNKLILAPMVRGSRLPTRLLALKYGADLVYTDETIDVSLLMSKRKVNEILGTIDYVDEIIGHCTFRTSPEEKDRLIFQMGTSNADRAVALAKMVQNDVAGIDVNMGCPKPYSTIYGMGAKLLGNRDNAKDILTQLVKHIPLPITCKIRIFENVEESIKLAKEFESTGISAIAVHGRTPVQQSTQPVNKDAIRQIAAELKIPVITNGGSDDIESYEDIEKFRSDCGASSVMIARGAQKNVSIFRKEGLLSIDDVAHDYLKYCVDYDNSVANTKYVLGKMYNLNDDKLQKKKFGREVEDAEKLEQICRPWRLREYCRKVHGEYEAKGLVHLPCSPKTRLEDMPTEILDFRKRMYEDQNITFTLMRFQRKYFGLETLPKVLIYGYAGRNKLPIPTYETKREDRLFYSIVTFNGQKFASLIWDREKKFAEQAAALVVCHHLGLFEEHFLIVIGCLLDKLPDDQVQLLRADSY